jgi:protein ImuA
MAGPWAAAQNCAPALLQLARRPADAGLWADIIKHRGCTFAAPLSLVLQPPPVLLSRHECIRRDSGLEVDASLEPELAG